MLWSRIRDREADWLWLRLRSYWLAWSLTSFGYTRLWSRRPWSLPSMITLTLNHNPNIVEGIPVVEFWHFTKNVIHYMKLFKLAFPFKICPCRRAKLCCDWWIPSLHTLTVSALYRSIGWHDRRQSKTWSRIRDHGHCSINLFWSRFVKLGQLVSYS